MTLLNRILRRADRGATTVEYALVIATLVVVSIGAIDYLTDAGEARLAGSDDRIGTPVDGAAYSVGSTTTFLPGTSSTTLPPSTALVVVQISATPSPTNDGSKWIANATITVTDGTTAISGVVVNGTWSGATGSGNSASCTTGVTGQCSVQRTNINDNTPTVAFTVDSMTKTGYSYVPPAPADSVSVACSPPLSAGCD